MNKRRSYHFSQIFVDLISRYYQDLINITLLLLDT
jgi:hypothetical protein